MRPKPPLRKTLAFSLFWLGAFLCFLPYELLRAMNQARPFVFTGVFLYVLHTGELP